MEPYFDPDYETINARINPPSVVVDNQACDRATIIKVGSANIHGVLLDVVQVLTDLDLVINKAYIVSDGVWFMDVFHVTDQKKNKLTDESVIEYIKQALGAKRDSSPCTGVQTCLGRTVGVQSIAEHTAIELTGTDRPGLLSEVSAVLADLCCNVKAAEVWTHNKRVACVVYVTDEKLGGPIEDQEKQGRIKELLINVMKGNDERRVAKTDFSHGLTHTERRLHQMMFADRDYEETEPLKKDANSEGRPLITIQNCGERGYSVVNVECTDRPKLLFDTVCTLTDMQYVVWHATIDSEGPIAHQEYYIRHMDGCTLDSEAEKQRVIKCLHAAIERRVSDGLRLELCTGDRVGLLSEVTRIFRENGLSVTRADVSTQKNGSVKEAVNVFYVTDASGCAVDMKIVETMRREMEIGQTILKVTDVPKLCSSPPSDSPRSKFSLSNLIKSQSERFLYSLSSMGWARSF